MCRPVAGLSGPSLTPSSLWVVVSHSFPWSSVYVSPGSHTCLFPGWWPGTVTSCSSALLCVGAQLAPAAWAWPWLFGDHFLFPGTTDALLSWRVLGMEPGLLLAQGCWSLKAPQPMAWLCVLTGGHTQLGVCVPVCTSS